MDGLDPDKHSCLLHGSVDEAQAALRTACSVIDKSAGKGVIHRNTAARSKSRLTARLKARQKPAA